jgi:hypothetical protein
MPYRIAAAAVSALIALSFAAGCSTEVHQPESSSTSSAEDGSSDTGSGAPGWDAADSDAPGCPLGQGPLCDGPDTWDDAEDHPCDACGDDQYCNVCNSAGPLYGTCEPIDQPDADEFACKWLSCAVGQVCLDSEPAGDGCPMAGCAELPEACDDDPSCECLEQAFGGFGCTEDSDGNVTVRGFLLTP